MGFPVGFPIVQGAGGGSQVGDQISMSDVGPIYTKPNGEQWLRSGTLIGSAGYAQASAVDYLKSTGTSGTQATSVGTYVGIAGDGTGKFVAAYGNATNVLVSTDFGATWATVAHNAGGTVVDVVWDSKDSLFVCAGNTTVLFLTSSQTAASVGSAWTARTGSVIVGGTADTARIKQSAAETVMVCSGGTTGNASRSTNGTTWTAANFVTSMSTANIGLVSLGSSIWISNSNASATYQRSTDGGVTWANATFPGAGFSSGAANGTICVVVDSANIYTSATGATGSWTARGAMLGTWTSLRIIYDGIRFLATATATNVTASNKPAFLWSIDGLNFYIRGIANKPWADTAAIFLGSDGTNLCFFPASTTGVVYGTFSNNLNIGTPYVVQPASVGSQSNITQITYFRVK